MMLIIGVKKTFNSAVTSLVVKSMCLRPDKQKHLTVSPPVFFLSSELVDYQIMAKRS